MAKKPTRSNLKPFTTVESQSIERYNMNSSSMDPRQFREKLTRANGALPGVKTNAMQWNRWNP